MKKLVAGLLFFSLFIGGFSWWQINKRTMVVKGEVVSKGDFALNVENEWDTENRKIYAKLDWEQIDDLSQEGYKLYQQDMSVGKWEIRSLNYGKQVSVLNIYPDIPEANTFKMWMDSLKLKDSAGNNLIEVTSISNAEYNKDPLTHLQHKDGSWKYDVIVIGSWDSNNYVHMQEKPADCIEEFIKAGRGVLFGHDTITANVSSVDINRYMARFAKYVGTTFDAAKYGSRKWSGSTKIKVINNGYLMKYPFELKNNMVLDIPMSHNIETQIKSVGTVWLEFDDLSNEYSVPVYEDSVSRGGWYLKTNGNVGMIQTGHSNGKSTMDERKVIANVLYNLAQISMEPKADDHSVNEKAAPDAPILNNTGQGTFDDFTIELDSKDRGQEYQWYVEANTKNNGILKSDIVKENIKSNIAGYIYRIKTDNYQEEDFLNEVEGFKDDYGRIPVEKFDQYIAPIDSSSLGYDTKATIHLNGNEIYDNYGSSDVSIMVVAVDRANNVSKVTTKPLMDYSPEYRVTEKYQGLGQLKADTYTTVPKGEDYTKAFPTAGDWIPYGYEYNDHLVEKKFNNTVITIPAQDKNYVVIYHYLAPVEINVRQVIVSPSEKLSIPDKTKLSVSGVFTNTTTEETTNMRYYNVASGLNDTPYTSILYPRAFNEHGEGFSLQLTSRAPSLYSYLGAVVTTEDVPHSESSIQTAEPLLLLDQIDPATVSNMIDWRNQFWVTMYFAPNTTEDVYLNVVDQRLHVYFANISSFTVYIDGQKYQDFEVNNKPTVESEVLEIPISEIRNKVTVEYKNNQGNPITVYWNNNWQFVNENK